MVRGSDEKLISKMLNKTIIFDAYGTLLDVGSIDESLTSIYGSLGKTIGTTWRKKQLEYSWLLTLMGSYKSFKVITMDALKFATASHNANLSMENESMLLQNYDKLKVFKDVKVLLGKLKKDHQLAVLSNANPEMLTAALDYNKILPLFDSVLSADAIKEFKPKATVYQYAVDVLKIPKNEISFISSNAWDAAGASFFGFHTVWINRKEQPFDDVGGKPNRIIPSLEELLT